jgi:hypothetical protein
MMDSPPPGAAYFNMALSASDYVNDVTFSSGLVILTSSERLIFTLKRQYPDGIKNKTRQNKPAGSSQTAEPAVMEKSTALIMVEIIEYVSQSVVVKTIIKKSTGNIVSCHLIVGKD